MRKSKRLIKQLLSELEKTGIASSACSKVGISRATYHRWRNNDIEFRLESQKAIEAGRANMVDFAESKLVTNVSSGQQRAIEFYLRHNDDRYRSMYGRELAERIRQIEDKHQRDFTVLEAIPDAILGAIPVEVYEKYFDLLNYDPVQLEDNDPKLKEAIDQFIAHKYFDSLMKVVEKSKLKPSNKSDSQA